MKKLILGAALSLILMAGAISTQADSERYASNTRYSLDAPRYSNEDPGRIIDLLWWMRADRRTTFFWISLFEGDRWDWENFRGPYPLP